MAARLRRASMLSPAIRAAIVFGISGVGFVGANLVFARTMTPANYAIVSLVVAFVQIAMPIGPLGLDTLVARRAMAPQPALLLRALGTSAGTGAAAAVIGLVFYHLEARLALLLLVSSVAGGANLVASAVYQGRGRFGPALALSQSQNLVLALASAVVVFATWRPPWLPCLVYAFGYVVSASAGWWSLLRHPHEARREDLGQGEMLSLASVTAATLVLIQIERLVIPRRLTLADLALFGVLASVAGSPYRVLQQGVGYTLLPRLRRASTSEERRRLVKKEARNGGLATLLASVGIWVVAPPLVAKLLVGKYVLTRPLLLAAILAGLTKVASAFATSAATALCTEPELARLRHLAWISLVVSAAACWVGAGWGVTGVIYGAALGWTGLAVAGAVLAAPHFRARTTVI